MTASSPASERSPDGAVEIARASDPVAAVLDARASGRAIALRTSGTTGRARTVLRTTDSWWRSFALVRELTGLDATSRLWLPGPMTSTLTLFAAVLARDAGAVVVDDPARATHSHLTPLHLTRALESGALPRGTSVTVAGDRLEPTLRVRAEAAGLRVTHYFGAAELSFVAWGRDATDLRAFPGVELEVRDDVIWVCSPYVALGYGPGGADGPFRCGADGFCTVGDRGFLQDGVLTVRGRGDDVVTTGAATVLVAEVEDVLREAVTGTVLVLGLPHPSLGQVVTAVLTDPADLRPARAAARARLDPAQRPRWWYAVDSVPVTAAGKADRALLAEALRAGRARRLSVVSP